MSATSDTPASDRQAIATAAAEALEKARATTHIADHPVLAGFDGFVDEIIHVVDRRHSMETMDFARIETIPAYAERIAKAAGKSANIELVNIETRFGGNGPLMAGAMAQLGAPTTYIGAIGREDDHSALMPLFDSFAKRCDAIIPVAAPGHTDALEFHDGKLMLGKPQNVQIITWDHLKHTVGLDALVKFATAAALIANVNWTLSGGVPSIWRGMIDELLPALPPHAQGKPRRVMIDLSDPAKRTDRDIADALALLAEMNTLAPVTLGLNLSESERINRVIDAGAFADDRPLAARVQDAAVRLQKATGLDTIVIHPREGAGAANAAGDAAWFTGPFTASPKLSTGAGDHFNGGFAFAQALGMPLDQSLAVGTAVSGAYVRDAESPTLDRLIPFLHDLPERDD